MTRPLTERDAEALKLFQHRNRLLTSIREHSLLDPAEQSYAYIFQRCCDILADAFHCNGVWAGDIDKEKSNLNLLAASPPLLQQTLQQETVLPPFWLRDLTTILTPLPHHCCCN